VEIHLTFFELYQAQNNFEGTVAAVYIIELPDSWGPVNFYRHLVLVNLSV
jgi:hypothetical protein